MMDFIADDSLTPADEARYINAYLPLVHRIVKQLAWQTSSVMGKVDISLQIENGRMQVHISASNGETYRALSQISNELRQSLTEQNFVQVNVQVSSQSGQSQQGRGEQQMFAPERGPAAGAEIADETSQSTVNQDDSVLLTV